MSTLIADFGLSWGKRRGWGVGGQLLRGLGKGCWEVEVVSGADLHISQTHISVPGLKSDTFSHESSGFLDRLDSLLFLPPCFSTLLPWSPAFPPQLPAFSEAHFTYRVLLYCGAPTWRGAVLRGAHHIDSSNKNDSYAGSTRAHTGPKTSWGNS